MTLSHLARRRGGASPERPFVIEHREALVFMLREAAELEHLILCQYLFAAFTLKQKTAEGVTEAQLAAIAGWRKTLYEVASQEMLHLAIVQNLLTTLGAAPHLERPDLPCPARHFPAGVRIALLPFGERAVRHFLYLERPEGVDLEDADGFGAAIADAVPAMYEGEIVPHLQDFATVGHLYRSIEAGFERLIEKYGEARVFIGPPRAQATEKDFRWPELVAVTDMASARVAIETIVEQGEGSRGDWRKAHFGRFHRMLKELERMRAHDPAFEPARNALAGSVRPIEGADGVPIIGDEDSSHVADLFNVAYELLLVTLERYFAHVDETDEQLSVLADVGVELMVDAVKPLGELLTMLPFGPDRPMVMAAPTFELFYATGYLLPHREAAWMVFEERLREAALFAHRVAGRAPAVTRVAKRFETLADRVAAFR